MAKAEILNLNAVNKCEKLCQVCFQSIFKILKYLMNVYNSFFLKSVNCPFDTLHDFFLIPVWIKESTFSASSNL